MAIKQVNEPKKETEAPIKVYKGYNSKGNMNQIFPIVKDRNYKTFESIDRFNSHAQVFENVTLNIARLKNLDHHVFTSIALEFARQRNIKTKQDFIRESASMFSLVMQKELGHAFGFGLNKRFAGLDNDDLVKFGQKLLYENVYEKETADFKDLEGLDLQLWRKIKDEGLERKVRINRMDMFISDMQERSKKRERKKAEAGCTNDETPILPLKEEIAKGAPEINDNGIKQKIVKAKTEKPKKVANKEKKKDADKPKRNFVYHLAKNNSFKSASSDLIKALSEEGIL